MRSAQAVSVGRIAQQDTSEASDDEGLEVPIGDLHQGEAASMPALPAEGLNFRAQMVAGKAARKRAAAEAEREAAAAADAAPSAEASACSGAHLALKTSESVQVLT